MLSSEITVGRQFVAALQPGDDVMGAIVELCKEHGIEQGYLPVFFGAFTTVALIGTCHPIEDDDAPLPDSVHLTNVEGSGSGLIAASDDGPLPHVHVSVGLKAYSATGYAGHLLSATVQYITELVVVEVLNPRMVRRPDAAARDMRTLAFD